MTPEEYERIKEAEKAHLRKLKELKQAVRSLERKRSIGRVLSDMVTGSRTLLDENQELIDELALQTARSEAHLEIALSEIEQEKAIPEVDEKTRARQIVEQIRAQSTSEVEEKPVQKPGSADERSSTSAGGARQDDPFPVPEKTIGRMR